MKGESEEEEEKENFPTNPQKEGDRQKGYLLKLSRKRDKRMRGEGKSKRDLNKRYIFYLDFYHCRPSPTPVSLSPIESQQIASEMDSTVVAEM